MRWVEHKWKERWKAKLDREFVCTVEDTCTPSQDSKSYRISCELHAGSRSVLFRRFIELSSTSLRISISTDSIQDEIVRQIDYAKSELKKIILRTLFLGYSSHYDYKNKKWEDIPIQEDWKIRA